MVAAVSGMARGSYSASGAVTTRNSCCQASPAVRAAVMAVARWLTRPSGEPGAARGDQQVSAGAQQRAPGVHGPGHVVQVEAVDVAAGQPTQDEGCSGTGVLACRPPATGRFVRAADVQAAVAPAEVADGRVVVQVADEITGPGVAGDEPGQLAGRHTAPVTVTGSRLDRRAVRRLRLPSR